MIQVNFYQRQETVFIAQRTGGNDNRPINIRNVGL